MDCPRRVRHDDVVFAEDGDVELAQVGVDPLRREDLRKTSSARLPWSEEIAETHLLWLQYRIIVLLRPSLWLSNLLRRQVGILEDPVHVSASRHAMAGIEVRAVAERDFRVRS